jgi:hypothetical protein
MAFLRVEGDPLNRPPRGPVDDHVSVYVDNGLEAREIGLVVL